MNVQNQKSLLSLSIPIFLELMLVNIVGNIDTIMLGKYSNKAVATVGGITQILNIQNVIFGFISLGTSILVAQFIGAKSKKRVHEVITVALILNLIIGLLLGIVYFVLWEKMFIQVQLPPELIPLGKSYFKLVGGFCVFQAMSLTCGAIMKSHGNPTPMLYVNIGVNLLNIFGNGLFIFGWFGAPILGVTGVGISTVVSRGLGCIVALIVMMKFCHFKFRHKFLIPFPFKAAKNLLMIGLPTAGENLAWNIGQLIILSMVNTMGTSYIAARTYLMLVATFIMTFSIALGQGTAVQVGQLVGAKRIDEAYHKCFKSVKISMCMAFTVTFLVILLKKPIMSIFTNDPTILAISYKVFPFMLLLEVGRVSNIVVINSLHASGDIIFPMIMGIIFMFGVAVVFSYVLGIKLHFGLIGMWIANAGDEWCRAIGMLIRWKSKKWITKSFV